MEITTSHTTVSIDLMTFAGTDLELPVKCYDLNDPVEWQEAFTLLSAVIDCAYHGRFHAFDIDMCEADPKPECGYAFYGAPCIGCGYRWTNIPTQRDETHDELCCGKPEASCSRMCWAHTEWADMDPDEDDINDPGAPFHYDEPFKDDRQHTLGMVVFFITDRPV